jgi:hypothetical protein
MSFESQVILQDWQSLCSGWLYTMLSRVKARAVVSCAADAQTGDSKDERFEAPRSDMCHQSGIERFTASGCMQRDPKQVTP